MSSILNLPPEKQQEFVKYFQAKQRQDSIEAYQLVVQRCFEICSDDKQDWKVSRLWKKEKSSLSTTECFENCALRYDKMNEILGAKYADEQERVMGLVNDAFEWKNLYPLSLNVDFKFKEINNEVKRNRKHPRR